jgi:hypothetical protein
LSSGPGVIFRGFASAWWINGVENYDDALLVQGTEEGIAMVMAIYA